MHRFLTLSVGVLVCTGCTVREPEVVLVNTARIEASLADRKRWVSEQKKRDRARFDADYGWILSSRTIGSKEARQIAYLFFYSAGTNCGSFEEPQLSDGTWRVSFLSGFPTAPGFSVFVDAKTGEVWQVPSTKLDVLALMRHE